MALIKKDQLHDMGLRVLDRHMSAESEKPLPNFSVPIPVAKPVVSQATINLDETRKQADKIIEAAEAKADSICQQAMDEGRTEGKAESATKMREALALMNEAVKEKKKIIDDASPEILRLAIKVAEQIIRSEVSLHRDVCLNIVAEAIARVSDREQIIVRVNREDSEFLKKYKDRLAGILDGVRSFSILEDQTVEPGGCVIETSLGFIDARIGTKLKSIEEALQKETVNMKQEEELANPTPKELAPAPLAAPAAPTQNKPPKDELSDDELFDDFSDDDLMLDDFDDKL